MYHRSYIIFGLPTISPYVIKSVVNSERMTGLGHESIYYTYCLYLFYIKEESFRKNFSDVGEIVKMKKLKEIRVTQIYHTDLVVIDSHPSVVVLRSVNMYHPYVIY